MPFSLARRVVVRRAAWKPATQPIRWASTDKALDQAPKRDPELFVRNPCLFSFYKPLKLTDRFLNCGQVLLGVMCGAFGLAGWYFGRSPTTSSPAEGNIRIAESTMPWQSSEETSGKYQYHPGGDTSQPLKSAPSALNEVVIPNVTLPAVC